MYKLTKTKHHVILISNEKAVHFCNPFSQQNIKSRVKCDQACMGNLQP